MPSSRQQSATVMIPSFCFRASLSNCSLSISFDLRPSRQSGLCSRFIALPILVLSTIMSPSHIIFTPTQSYEIVHWFLFFCGEVLLTTTSYPIADSIFTKVSTLMLFPVYAATHCGLCFIPRSFCKLGLVPPKRFHGFFYNVFLVHESTSRYFNNAISYFGVIVKLLFVFYSFFSVTGCNVTGRFFSVRVHKCRRYPFQHEFPRRRVALRPYPRIMPMIPLRILSKEQEHGRSCSFDKEIFQLPLSGVNSS